MSVPSHHGKALQCKKLKFVSMPWDEANLGRHDDKQQFQSVVRRLYDVTWQVDGGIFFVVMPLDDAADLKLSSTDQGHFYKHLKTTCSEGGALPSVFAESFLSEVQAFAAHSDNDRWPSNHENQSLAGRPKDGCFVISLDGTIGKAAAGIVELSAPCYEFPNEDGCGMRHRAALHAASMSKKGIVILRSSHGQDPSLLCLG